MAPAAAASRQLTRAELRRHAQGAPSDDAAILELTQVAPEAPVASRRVRRSSTPSAPEAAPADESVDVADLAELDTDALLLPHVENTEAPVSLDVPHPVSAADVPVVEASVAAIAEPSPTLLPTSPITLPAPTRRSRVRPARTASDEPVAFELLSPSDAANGPVEFAAAAVDDESAADTADRRAQDSIDEFEAAARLFAFTGETPVQVASEALADDAVEAQHPGDHVGRRRFLSFKRVATASFSVGVFGVVGLMAVGMTTPVGAVAAAQGTASTPANVLVASDVSADAGDIQAYVAPADVQSSSIERSDGFQATSLAQIAADSGIANFSSFFTNDPTSAIQWPFAVGVPITYGFGMRSGTMHEGADFVPGAGAPVQAIADGTVRIATESGGAYGVTVVIDHVIDGERVASRYAHMQYGSLKVKAGDTITVGTVIGNTGNTGRSFGAHTHFEILAGGTTAIDPIPWLRQHAGG